MSKTKQQPTENAVTLQHLPLAAIGPDPNQPRKKIDLQELQELADSIEEQGVLQPILVRPDADGYMVVCGERRFRAAELAGLKTIPATIRQLTDKEALEIQITENLQRRDVEPMEEGESFLAMVERMGYSNADIAARIGKSEKFVARRLKLTQLIPQLKDWMRQGVLPIGHAERLAPLPAYVQEEFHRRHDNTYMPVPKLPELINWISYNAERKLKDAIFNTEYDGLIEGVPACSACPKNTAVYSLFDTEEAVCTDRSCFENKTAAGYERNLEAALRQHETLLVNYSWQESATVAKLKAEGHHVLEYRSVKRLDPPREPVRREPDVKDYGTMRDYRAAVKEAEAEYREDYARYEEELREYDKLVLQSHSAFDVVSGRFINVTLTPAGERGGVLDPDSAIREQIEDLEYKKRRGAELDGEKVLKRMVDHMSANVPDGDLSEAEMDVIYLDYIKRIGFGKEAEDVLRKFGVEKTYADSDEVLEGILRADKPTLAKAVRVSLLSNYGNGMPGSLGSTIMAHLAGHWYPEELKRTRLEQEEKRIRREAKIDAQINELKSKLSAKEETEQ